MKICILSMQRVKNFGSLLQSYALKKILEGFGHRVKFIDIERNEFDDRLMDEGRKDFWSESKPSKNLISKIHKLDIYTINRIKIRKLQNRQDEKFERFFDRYLPTANTDEYFDLCIIGSDEVFNCAANSRWGFTTQLFGNVRQAEKVITYAASCGATEYEMLPEPVTEKIREALKKIQAFSVRDDNTHKFVSRLTDRKIIDNLDPVLIGDFEDEIKNCDITDKLPERYCIVYSYYNRIHKPEEIKAIKQFCRERALEIVTIGAPQMWIKKHIVLDPFEVLAAFKRAEFVITDTFHGTIFSAKFADRFAVIVRQSNRNKLTDLLHKLKIKEHNIQNLGYIDNVWRIQNNKEEINKIISNGREKAINYLKLNLK